MTDEKPQLPENNVERLDRYAALYAALSAFQGEVPEIPRRKTARIVSKKTNTEYSYRYADLADIRKVCNPLLAKHGLAVFSLPFADKDTALIGVRTVLVHKAGARIDCSLAMRPGGERDSPQEKGTVITYCTRYTVSGILGIASEDDDDAAAASGQPPAEKKPQKKNAQYLAEVTEEIAALSDMGQCEQLGEVIKGSKQNQATKDAALELLRAKYRVMKTEAGGA